MKTSPDSEKSTQHLHRNEQLLSLTEGGTDLISLTSDQIELLRSNFTKHPKLGLLYNRCCAADPLAYVANDESLLDENRDMVYTRINDALDPPVFSSDTAFCQGKVREHSADSGDLWICASCCEIVYTVDEKICTLALGELPDSFRLTFEEEQRQVSWPKYIVQNHRQVLVVNDVFCQLNPDRVDSLNSIRLCVRCFLDPSKHPFSIACGHDYGRYGNPPELNDVASNCISPV